MFGIAGLIGVEYFLFKSDEQNINTNQIMLKKTPGMMKKRRVYRLYREFNRNRNSSIFLINLTPLEEYFYCKYILANF